MDHAQALSDTEKVVRQHKRELTAAAAATEEVVRRSAGERAAASQQQSALAAAHRELAGRLDAAKHAQAAAERQAAVDAARVADMRKSHDRHKQDAVKARRRLPGRLLLLCCVSSEPLSVDHIMCTESALQASINGRMRHQDVLCWWLMRTQAASAQATAHAAEAERLLAKSLAERAELQARYMALGAKLGLIVRLSDASAHRTRQARPARPAD